MRRFVLAVAAFALSVLFVADVALAQIQPPLRPPGGIALDSGTKTAAATAGAATLSKFGGVVTSEAITTAAGSDYVLTLTNTLIAATDQVFASVANGTNTTEGLAINRIQPGSGSVIIRVRNTHASSALNGTIKISFSVIKN